MKKLFLIGAFLGLCVPVLWAQDDPMREKEEKTDESEAFKKRETPADEEDEEPSWRDNVFFGGNFWLQFGNNTVVDISPVVGYRLTPKLQVGVGGVYQYFGWRNPYNMSIGAGTYTYGGRAFARYFLYSNLFIHGEYENLNMQYISYLTNPLGELKRGWVPALLGGGGYSFPIGQRAALQMTILYNVLWDRNRSFYSSPLITRMGFVF